MADEKKEEVTKETAAVEQAKAAQAPAEAAAPAAQAPEQAKEAGKDSKPVKQERPANCAGCKKSIKNKRWYYRNGKYYCGKRCWSTTNKKPAKTEEVPPAA